MPGHLVHLRVDFNAKAESRKADYQRQAEELLRLFRLRATAQKRAGENTPISIAFGANGSQEGECRKLNASAAKGEAYKVNMGITASNQAAVVERFVKLVADDADKSLAGLLRLAPIKTLSSGLCCTGVGVSQSWISKVPTPAEARVVVQDFVQPVLDAEGSVWFLANQTSASNKVADIGGGVAADRRGMHELRAAYYDAIDGLVARHGAECLTQTGAYQRFTHHIGAAASTDVSSKLSARLLEPFGGHK